MKAEGYSYDRFGSKGERVGQAVSDIWEKDQSAQTVEETLEEWGPDFALQLEECIQDNKDKFKSPFYVFVLTKKEMWAQNIIRNWFIARQSEPTKADMMTEYAHAAKTLYKVDPKRGKLDILWALPGIEDCISIAKHPQSYDPSLHQWIEECFRDLQTGRHSEIIADSIR